MTLRIGITGGIASGKSTVSSCLQRWGYSVIDADVIAKDVMQKNGSAFLAVVAHFSSDILDADGEIERMKLAEIIFQDDKKRMELNQIVHPMIQAEMERQFLHAQKNGIKMVFFDVPLLFDTDSLSLPLDFVIVVTVKPDIQLQRLMERNGYTKEHALCRIQSQMPVAKKEKYADFIIYNNGTEEETEQQLKKVLEILIKRQI
ncbi:MAG: dephospho-CoA kinase [Bacillales bacterium]|nr:dephospho-CoA kinase [Bacillales bacterium]